MIAPSESRRRDVVLRVGAAITCNDSGDVLRDAYILVRDGRIHEISEGALPDEVRQSDIHDRADCVAFPGLINAHSHVAGVVFRGTEDSTRSFMDVASIEYALGPEDVEAFSALGCAEAARFGTTLINDIYHWVEATARACRRIGVRAVLALKVHEFDLRTLYQGGYAPKHDHTRRLIARTQDFVKTWRDDSQLSTVPRVGPHAPNTCSPELLAELAAIAVDLQVGLHTHLAQNNEELRRVSEVANSSPVELLDATGVLSADEGLAAAHLCLVDDRGIGLFSDSRARWLHCPAMNARRGLAAPQLQLRGAGCEPALGTDWLTYDPWPTMHHAIAVGRLQARDIDAISAEDALKMMTIEAARALRLDRDLGSLEVGKLADIAMVRWTEAALQPLGELIPTLIYSGSGRDVTHVYVGGTLIVEDGTLTTCDINELIAAAVEAKSRVLRQVEEGQECLLTCETNL